MIAFAMQAFASVREMGNPDNSIQDLVHERGGASFKLKD